MTIIVEDSAIRLERLELGPFGTNAYIVGCPATQESLLVDADTSNITPPPEILLNDGDVIRLGELEFTVLHTPGHTPGSLCFKVGPYLISGDTIFPGGPGKTGSGDDFRQIIKSITERIFILPDDTQIYPGHGDSTVLKKEEEEFAVFASRPHAEDLHGDVLWL
jgi:glyoxylase-like metal-dependent hydrolase (beta-lactamase superfamily II)